MTSPVPTPPDNGEEFNSALRPPVNSGRSLFPGLCREARSAVHREYGFLPDKGMYAEHRMAMYSAFALIAGQGLARDAGRKRAAQALRRLADRLERDGANGLDQDGFA